MKTTGAHPARRAHSPYSYDGPSSAFQSGNLISLNGRFGRGDLAFGCLLDLPLVELNAPEHQTGRHRRQRQARMFEEQQDQRDDVPEKEPDCQG